MPNSESQSWFPLAHSSTIKGWGGIVGGIAGWGGGAITGPAGWGGGANTGPKDFKKKMENQKTKYFHA